MGTRDQRRCLAPRRARDVASLIEHGWRGREFCRLPYEWCNISAVAIFARLGLTPRQLHELTQRHNLASPYACELVAKHCTDAQDLINWADSSLLDQNPLEHNMSVLWPDPEHIEQDVQSWTRLVGPDASWFAAAGLTLAEAEDLARTAGGLDTAKLMAALVTAPVLTCTRHERDRHRSICAVSQPGNSRRYCPVTSGVGVTVCAKHGRWLAEQALPG